MSLLTDREFYELKEYIAANYGIELKDEKRGIVEARLNSILSGKKLESFSQYLSLIKSGDGSCLEKELVDKLTTNHTYFMREMEHFNFFRDTVMPYLYKTVKDKDLRIWCAGCSTGEEAYMLAMIILDYLGYEAAGWDTTILAVDISHRVLDIAEKGIYPAESLALVPYEWKRRYFAKYEENYMKVGDRLRKSVIFRNFNIAQDTYTFKKKFHAIFCRNVMIYFNDDIKRELIGRFYNLLSDGGYLFVGQSESLVKDRLDFKYVIPSVYRKEV